MSRPIMPAQSPDRLKQSASHVEDAFSFFYGSTIVVVVVVVSIEQNALKEARGRKLLRVANDDNLPAPRERADRIFRFELGRLVHDHEIELKLAGREVLSNGQRSHHETRLECHQSIRGPEYELPNRNVSLLLVDLICDKCHLGPGAHRAALIAVGNWALIDQGGDALAVQSN